MSGVSRLILLSIFLVVVAMYMIAANGAAAPNVAPGPPSTKAVPVEETLHGQKIVDPYRWLESADSPESEDYVRQQLAYTRSRLDPLPGRESTHARVSELLT